MSLARPLTDDVYLHAYLDGELSEAEAREVELRLATDAKARVLVASLSAQQSALAAKYALPQECPKTKAMAAQVVAHATRPRASLAAWAVLGLGLVLTSALAGYFARELLEPRVIHSDPPFVSSALGAQAVYAPDVRHPVEVTAADERQLAHWLSQRTGMTVKFAKVAGWSLLGGRLLPDGTEIAALLMYEDQNGQRVSLLQRRSEGLAAQSLRYVPGEEVRAFYWVEGPTAFALAGRLGKFELKALAQAMHADMATTP